MLDRSQRLQDEEAPNQNEWRTSFQRDRDRILYTGHFRRLSGITQVTTPSELHAFHNRLTHTLEVAQIARRIAERVNFEISDSGDQISPDVCEAAALAHDLGHPPFGHNGEQILDQIAIGQSASYTPRQPSFDGYEGNAQSLRILLKLAVRKGSQRGLNLTAATLRATIKYPWQRNENPQKPSKFGVFREELNDFSRIWDGQPRFIQTLEAQIMDWADDVAYSTHDLYDFALAGIIPLSVLKVASASELRNLLSSNTALEQVSEEAFEVVAIALSFLPDPPLHNTSRLGSQAVGMLKEWVSMRIARYAGECLAFNKDGSIIEFQKLLTIEEEVAILKALTYHYAIGSPALAIRQVGEKRILTTLFEVLDESAHSDMKLLSEDSQKSLEAGEKPTRIILDLLSSMTDAQAISMHHKLTGIAPISILDVTTTSAI